MSMAIDRILALLETHIPRQNLRTATDGRRLTVELAGPEIKPALAALLAAERVRFVTLAAVDLGTDIDLLYTVEIGGRLLTLRTVVAKEASRVDSIADLMPAAEMGEKEASELFGIEFAGLPRQQNLILPADWPADQRPLRQPLTGDLFPQARLPVENFLRDAMSVRVAPSSLARREAAGLPKQPAIASADAQSMQEFVELVKRTGFDRRAGYDWAKRKLRYK
jgi:Ni,Fe-hydrogenase III component G